MLCTFKSNDLGKFVKSTLSIMIRQVYIINYDRITNIILKIGLVRNS